MNDEVKDTWYNGLRCRLSYWAAKAYQNSSLVLDIPLGWLWMDFLYNLSDWLSPFPTAQDCLNPIMVEVIRERMGISHEEFEAKIEEVRGQEERKQLGLPEKGKQRAGSGISTTAE